MQQQQSIAGKFQSVVSNPIGKMIFDRTVDGFSKQSQGLLSKIFTAEIRDYFNVNTDLAGKKLLKLVVPFKTFEWDDEIKKLELYIPLISFTTLILFSTIVEGISSQKFEPKMGKKMLFILLLTFLEVVVAKCSENVVSNLNIGYLQLSSLVSYRFVPLAILTIILTLTSLSIPYLHLVGLIYVLISDTYFCKLELNEKARAMFQEEGLGTKIALLVHFLVTLAISWVCDII